MIRERINDHASPATTLPVYHLPFAEKNGESARLDNATQSEIGGPNRRDNAQHRARPAASRSDGYKS